MAERARSLRGRLLGLLVGGIGAAWLAIAVATFFDARYHAERVFDEQLTEYAEVLAAIAGHEAYEVPGETPSLGGGHTQSCTFQVYAPTGELLLRSHAAPSRVLATDDGFSSTTVDGVRWRVFRHADRAQGLVVVAAHRQSDRDAVVGQLAAGLLLPMLWGLPLVALVIWLAVRQALAPLAAIAGDVGLREAGRLAPVAAEGVPLEVRPLAQALNRLFARLEASFENERRFTGDAAHELRTPLAALRTQAEVALTTASDERRRHALEQVVAGVERATRLVDQMLALARLDAITDVQAAPVDLASLCREAGGASHTVAIEVDDAGPVEVAGDEVMLRALVRNLVENAARHAATRVRVGAWREGCQVRLDVEDDGPGVEAGLRARLFDRFYRGPGPRSGVAGLGLSIARRVAELHGGTIEAAASVLGGLRVAVSLPAAS